MDKVLIITNRKDDHAKAVVECLIRKGAQPIRWFPDEFLLNQRATQKITSNEKHSIRINDDKGGEIDLIDVSVVWYRRSKFPCLPEGLASADLKIIESENRMHMRSIWLTLGENAKWVNPLSSFDKSNSKILQLREASRVGLTIPDTLVSNDKKSIVEFINSNEKDGAIYKTFLPVIWEQNDEIYSCYSSAVTASMLPEEDNLSLTPGIYQKIVNKKFEVRVTFIGEEYVAVKIHNSDELDWRILSMQSKLKISPIRIPDEIEVKCKLLMNKLGIVFGCFDFIVTPTEEYVFLEVNEMGQFLWIEERLPELHLLDQFCEFLLLNTSETRLNASFIAPFTLREFIDSPSNV